MSTDLSRVITLLGAESTGKTTLSQTLALALRAVGADAVVVPEVLRAFCEQAGRTPRIDEQAGIAAEQARRIEVAAAGGSYVVADTAPLMIAVYSDFIFGDPSLYGEALAFQRRCGASLLTGLDLAWEPDGLQRDGPQVREPVDALLRAALGRGGVAHAVVYGHGAHRTATALQAAARFVPALAERLRTADTDASGPATPPRRWRRACLDCLDADCEHLSRRADPP